MQPKLQEPDTSLNDPTLFDRKLSTQSDRSYASNNYLSGPPSNQEVSTRNTPIVGVPNGIRKRVNFLLNKTPNKVDPVSPVPSSPEQREMMRSKVYRKTRKKSKSHRDLLSGNQIKNFHCQPSMATMKNVVFNGTYPIDRPEYKNRFLMQPKVVDSCSSLSELDEQEEEEYLNDTQGKKSVVVEESKAIQSMSMQELVEDKNVKFNLTKMRQEFHKSLVEFEKFLAKGAPKRSNVQTFAIDEPL